MKTLLRSLLPVAFVACSCGVVAAEPYIPDGGFVPNADTAMKIAEAVWRPIYGNSIDSQKPFHARLDGKNWVVESSLPPGKPGSTARAVIAKRDGRIMEVSHGK